MLRRCCMAGLLGVGKTCTLPADPDKAMTRPRAPRRITRSRTNILRRRVNVLAGHSHTRGAGQRQDQRAGRPQGQGQTVRAARAELLDELTKDIDGSGHAQHGPVHPRSAPGTVHRFASANHHSYVRSRNRDVTRVNRRRRKPGPTRDARQHGPNGSTGPLTYELRQKVGAIRLPPCCSRQTRGGLCTRKWPDPQGGRATSILASQCVS